MEMPPRRRNPQGAWGLWPNTASLVVNDATASPFSSFLVFDSQDPYARPTRVLQQPARAEHSLDGLARLRP